MGRSIKHRVKGLAIREPTPLQSCRLPTDTWFMCPTGCEKMPYEKLFQSGQKFSKNVWQRWCDLQTSFRESLGIFGKWSKIFGKWSAMLVWPTRHLKCMTQKKFILIWKAFQNTEEWRFSFWNIFFRFRDIDVFILCKLDQWWCHNTATEKW